MIFVQCAFAVAIAIALVQLGIASAWVTILSITLKAILGVFVVVALCVAMLFGWHRYKRPVMGDHRD